METIPGDGDKKTMVSNGLDEAEGQREGSEKALPLLLLIFLPKAPGAISPPLPAQRPNCSTPPVSQPHRNLEKKRRGIECANTSRLPPTAKPHS